MRGALPGSAPWFRECGVQMIRDQYPARPAPAESSAVLDIDPQRFEHLLALAGTAHAQELLYHLTQDLRTVLERLEAALPAADRVEQRAQTHVLVVLADAVGAGSLKTMADRVNRCRKAADGATIDALMPPMLGQLRALVAFVADRQAGSPA